MIESILTKLGDVSSRYAEIESLLSQPDVTSNQEEYIKLSKEYADLSPVVNAFIAFKKAEEDLEEAKILMKDSDPEIKEMAELEFETLKDSIDDLEIELKRLLLPKDPDDSKDVFLEIRAGTGGDEAALFSGDLYRMYSRLSERNNWKMEIVSVREGDHGGFKELVTRIEGSDVYKQLKFEAGVHRVQRVPTTESQGRVHTSIATVAVLPEAEEVDLSIAANDLKIDVYRSSGPGGQSVNTTDSAVRITHIPTGLVVTSQDEKSQLKNKNQAMRILRARLLKTRQDEAAAERAKDRKDQVGSGERSDKIRTYNYKDNRVSDHRINLTIKRLDQVLDGDLEDFVNALIADHETSRLSNLEE